MEMKNRNSEDRHLKRGDYWERQPGETPKAWQAFRCYRDTPKRSHKKVCEALGKSPRQIQFWASKYRWTERVCLFDDRVRELAADSEDAVRRGMLDRHASFTMAMQQKLAERLKTLEPSEISPGLLTYALDVCQRLERAARGLPEVEVISPKCEVIIHAPDESMEIIDPDKPRIGLPPDPDDTVQ